MPKKTSKKSALTVDAPAETTETVVVVDSTPALEVESPFSDTGDDAQGEAEVAGSLRDTTDVALMVEEAPVKAEKPAGEKQPSSEPRATVTPATRLEEFIVTLKRQWGNLTHTPSPTEGLNAYQYLLAKAETGLPEGNLEVQHKFVNALYNELTFANTNHRTARLEHELEAFKLEDTTDVVVWAREVLARKEASVVWIREAEEVTRELRFYKREDRLDRAIGFWKRVLDASVAQEPVVKARLALEAMIAYEGHKPAEMEDLIRKADEALTLLNSFEPICGCGCGKKLTRKDSVNGGKGKGKFYRECYDSYAKSQPKKADPLVAAAAMWGVTYSPAGTTPEEDYFKPVGKRQKGQTMAQLRQAARAEREAEQE